MRKLFIFCSILYGINSFSQEAPNKTNQIKISGVTFSDICNALLDAGYIIEKRDSELGTVTTEMRAYTNSFNASYSIYVRVKDSTAFMQSYFTAPLGVKDPLFDRELVQNITDKKGKTKSGRIDSHAFKKMQSFAISLGKPIEYLIQKQ